MRRLRRRLATALTGVAVLGLVVTPVVHSELHVREAEAERQSALAVVFHLGFLHARSPAQERVLRHALSHAFDDGEPESGLSDPDEPQTHHHHSHGGPGRHGEGSLQHGGVVALCADAPLDQVHAQPVRPLPAQPPALLLSPRYSTPKNSQAPPAASIRS